MFRAQTKIVILSEAKDPCISSYDAQVFRFAQDDNQSSAAIYSSA